MHNKNISNDCLLSPKSEKRKVKLINSEFKSKYDKKEDLVYDFTSNSYVKSNTSRVQDLIEKYNTRIVKGNKSLFGTQIPRKESNEKKEATYKMNPINIMYAPRESRKVNNPFENASISSKFKGLNISTGLSRSNTPPICDKMSHDKSHEMNQLLSSDLKSSYSVDRKSSLSNEYQSSSPKYDSFKQDSPKYNFPKYKTNLRSTSVPNTRSFSPLNSSNEDSECLYGPSVELVHPITFTILNTVYDFNKGVENTLYYLEVTSNVSWKIKKDLNSIRKFLKNHDLGTKADPLNKQIRDNMISTILNSLYSTLPSRNNRNDLQFFILTDITKSTKSKGEFLLLNDVPYIFKLVGKALVSYNMDSRVHKIFILDSCKIEESVRNDCAFYISSGFSEVELFASCKIERDEWVREIRDFINKKY
ncbi:hypothetical protein P3W45_001670 [Vairimorpha bombi]|jgi:hypothetical protein